MPGNASLDRSDWTSTLDEATATHEGELITIEVMDQSIGHQYEAERLPFSYLSYDHKSDAVVVAVGGRPPRYPVVLRHIVAHPKEIDVSTVDVPETAIRVLDQDDTATLITFYPAGPAAQS
ncbi:DUF5335 family protein [Streptomyces sp. NPDC059525]|uniref:DUF5335 family protein n=1 Tax=Streptomyces sp. NPDC059525 TaxID=3346857 RepID=UPI0036ABE062